MVRSCDLGWPFLLFFAAVLACDTAAAQTMYKYRGENGEWIFTDRPPDGGQDVETRSTASRVARGADGSRVMPSSGRALSAYP